MVSPLLVIGLCLLCADAVTSLKMPLTRWTLQSSKGGPVYPVNVPCTVMAGLIQNGNFSDWWYDTNLKVI